MAAPGFKDGTIPFKIPQIDAPCQTYYKTIGNLSSDSPRLVAIHGGPGTGHEYLLPFAHLWQQFRIPVVFYDQIGCASSTHLPETVGDESLWQESHFIAELNNLLDCLRLRDGPGFHILGHSWGGRLAAAFAASQPQGLQRLIIASGVASTETVVKGNRINRKQLPLDVQLALDEEEQRSNTDSLRFRDAMNTYYRTFLCRTEPFPPEELLPGFKHMSEDKTVRNTM